MNKFLAKLLLLEKYEITTRLSKEVILKKFETVIGSERADYRGRILENGVLFAEKNKKRFNGGHRQNSFAPVAKAKIYEKDGLSVVSITLRMNLLCYILFLPLYLLSFFTFVIGLMTTFFDVINVIMGGSMTVETLSLAIWFPLMRLILFFAFYRPAKRMKEMLEIIMYE